MKSRLANSCIRAAVQVLCQYTHNDDEGWTIDEKFYYVHGRLGSVGLMVDYDDSTDAVGGVRSYTCNLFGDEYTADGSWTDYNPWQFTGQWCDADWKQVGRNLSADASPLDFVCENAFYEVKWEM